MLKQIIRASGLVDLSLDFCVRIVNAVALNDIDIASVEVVAI